MKRYNLRDYGREITDSVIKFRLILQSMKSILEFSAALWRLSLSGQVFGFDSCSAGALANQLLKKKPLLIIDDDSVVKVVGFGPEGIESDQSPVSPARGGRRYTGQSSEGEVSPLIDALFPPPPPGPFLAVRPYGHQYPFVTFLY
ncbi:hypothetical protein EVAR_7267_1 [Eumeta japonica]|uniref:Uncharacterized protein n=1 Tax=Eumeta variegata TaxID=151549 RepID=A0A4C1T5C6_EUMVA|nr:hypothetical protein EVAR_7267_1 [Eumeta japonica]